MLVEIIDPGTGNLRSLAHAIQTLGHEARVLSEPPATAEVILLPGVGSFGHAMENLRRAGWVSWLRATKSRIIGICLGMQLFFESSEESPGAEGLGLIRGRVRLLHAPKVPHIGWARLAFRGPAPLEWAYFVHSYVVEPADPSLVEARATYGESFPAVVRRGNLAGVQFHPEKSQGPGVAYLAGLVKGDA